MRGADDAVHVLLGRQRHRPGHLRTGTGNRVDDLPRRAVDDLMVIGLEPNADLLSRHGGLYVLFCVVPGGQGFPADCFWQRPGVPWRPGPMPYLRMFVTRPAPTVRPPSRIANRRPSSIAIGWISSTFIFVLSPGSTISVPSGSCTTPVTSVVRKENCGRELLKNGGS